MNRRTALRGGAAILSMGLPGTPLPGARAQTAGAPGGQSGAQSGGQAGGFPNRPVRMVVPWPPGQATDLAGRLVAQALSASLNQTVLAENRPGAGGMIGTDHVAKSAPDGYTLLAGSAGPVTINPLLRRTAYDPERELAPIAMTSNSPYVLVTRPGFPARDLAGFIDMVRAAPEKHTFSSSGAGATAHLITETFNRRAGLRAVHVPFNGSAPGLTAVAAGQVDYTMETLAGVQPLLRGGSLKAFGISLRNGSVLAPEIPPVARHPDLQGFDMGAWLGVMAPAGTPEPILSLLAARIAEAMRGGDLREKMGLAGLEPDFRDTAAFTQHLRIQKEMFGEIIRLAEIRLE